MHKIDIQGLAGGVKLFNFNTVNLLPFRWWLHERVCAQKNEFFPLSFRLHLFRTSGNPNPRPATAAA